MQETSFPVPAQFTLGKMDMKVVRELPHKTTVSTTTLQMVKRQNALAVPGLDLCVCVCIRLLKLCPTPRPCGLQSQFSGSHQQNTGVGCRARLQGTVLSQDEPTSSFLQWQAVSTTCLRTLGTSDDASSSENSKVVYPQLSLY